MGQRRIKEVDSIELTALTHNSYRHAGAQNGVSRKYQRAFVAILMILSVLFLAIRRYNQSQMSVADKLKYKDTQARKKSDTSLTEETSITSSIETTLVHSRTRTRDHDQILVLSNMIKYWILF